MRVSVLANPLIWQENLTFDYLDESDVYFGNQYRLGEALIEVSEIREPCWKIQEKYNIPDLVKRILWIGFYKVQQVS